MKIGAYENPMFDVGDWLVSTWQRTDRFHEAAVGNACWARFLHDARTGELLGFVRESQMSARRWPWTRSRCFEMSELPDVSHVCTFGRPWWGRGQWRVYDAEDALVGRIVGARLLDPWGRCHGRFDSKDVLRDPDARMLARVERRAADTRVSVCVTPASPFWKMLVLGSAVVREFPPDAA